MIALNFGLVIGTLLKTIIPLLRGNSTWIGPARFHGSRLLLQMARSRVSVEASPTAVVIPGASYDRHSHISTEAMYPFFSQGPVVKRDHGIASRTLESHVL